MPNTRTFYHAEHTICDKDGNENVLFYKSTLKDVVTDEKSNVNLVGKLMFFVECNNTGAAGHLPALTVPGFALVEGAHLNVKFSNNVSFANPDLSINGSSRKPIYKNGTRLNSGNVIKSGDIVTFEYDGASFHIVGGLGSAYIASNNSSKLYLCGVANSTEGSLSTAYFNNNFYIGSGGAVLYGTAFSGDGSFIRNLDASNIDSGTLGADRLPDVKNVAGTYGPLSTSASLEFGNALRIPRFEVDDKGRIISIESAIMKLPTSDGLSSDENVTSTKDDDASIFFLTGSPEEEETTGHLIKNSRVYVMEDLNGATALVAPVLYTDKLSMSSSATAAIYNSNGLYFAGRAATVETISTHIEDNIIANGLNVVTKATSANFGYLLYNGFKGLKDRVGSIESSLPSSSTSYTIATTQNVEDLRVNLQNQINDLKNNTIASINSQISSINNKLNGLGTQVTYSLDTSTNTLTISPK